MNDDDEAGVMKMKARLLLVNHIVTTSTTNSTNLNIGETTMTTTTDVSS